MFVQWFLDSLEVVAGVAAVAALLIGLHNSRAATELDTLARRRIEWRMGLLLTSWFFVALGTSVIGLYHGSASRIPTIQYAIVVPIVIGIFLYRRSASLRFAVDALPQEWIIGVQVYRVLGASFLWLLAMGRLPGVFAWPAGCGDVLVGVLAPIAALIYARRQAEASLFVRAWNVLGLLDLGTALTIGLLSTQSPIQLLSIGHPNILITEFPLAMIPVFLVPLSILLHFASLSKLSRVTNGRASSNSPIPGSAHAASAMK